MATATTDPLTPRKASIYTLTQDHNAGIALIMELDGGEMTPEQAADFDALMGSIKQDALGVIEGRLNVRAWLKEEAASIRGRRDQVQAHADHLKAREDSLEKAADRIENSIKEYAMTTGMVTTTQKKTETTKEIPGKKIKAGEWVVSIQRNGGVCPMRMVEGEEVPETYCKSLPDNEKIRAALEAGEKLPFAVLEERGIGIRIK